MDQKSDSLLTKELEAKIQLLERRFLRERHARKEAEQLLESKSLELFNANKSLESLNRSLERNIQRGTQTLRTLLDNLHAGVLLNDENGRILFVNKEFLRVFNAPLNTNELVGMDQRKSADVIKNQFKDPEEFISIVDECIESNKDVQGYELELLNNRILDCDFISIKSAEDFVGHLWQVRDVTEEREAQKKITYSEEKYRGIIENMELGLLEVDNDHIIMRAYSAFCEMTGYKEHELLGKKATDIFLPDDLKQKMEAEDAKRIRGEQSIYESRMIKKDGEQIFVLISGAPIYNETGEVVGSIGIHYNITRRKQLEEQLRQARNQAEQAREAEKQFLANMSHEIRNPINAIIGMTNLLYDTKPTRQQLELLDKLKFSSDILLGLISGILDLSKIESGSFELVQEPLDLRDTLAAIIDITDFRKGNKDIKTVLKLDESIDFKVLADPTVINQIFINLIGNSLKFTEKGFIEVSGTMLEDRGDSALFVFAVKDTGIGIPPDKIKSIFNQFNQGDSQTKLKYGGTGLGLAIVKQLVGGYHGDIDVESRQGQGTIFQFTLQLAKAGDMTKKKTEIQIKSSSSHVLIVEDNSINQQYLSGILNNWGVTYDVADNGQEALIQLQDKKYDMILMDIRMPIMDGYETTIRIRSDHENMNYKTPIVALTASALVDEKEKALAVGMNYHLSKPFTPAQLAYAFEAFGLIDMVEKEKENPGFSFSSQLNVNYLNEFYGNDFDRARMMFQIFINTIDHDIDKLKQSFKERNWDQFASMAHKIKPNFSMVGLSDISETLKTFEQTRSSSEIRELVTSDFDSFLIDVAKGKVIVEKELDNIPQL